MHIIYDIKTRSLLIWLVSDFDSSNWQLKLTTVQNDFSNFRPGWWQFCWITGVKFNSIQSIIVSLLHIMRFTVCDEEFDSFCCRFTTMSWVIEHGCRIASPVWAVNKDNLFYWNTTTGNNSSTDVSLLRLTVKIKCKANFSYPMLACRSVNRPKHVVRWYEEFPDCAITYHTCQHTAGSRSGKTS